MISIVYILNAVFNPIQVLFNGNCCVQCLIKYFMVLPEVFFGYFSVSAYYIMDSIDWIDSHGPSVIVVDFKYGNVLQGLNQLVFKYLVHGDIVIIYSSLLSLFLIELLVVWDRGVFLNGWSCDRFCWFWPWRSFRQFFVQGVLCDQDDVAVIPVHQNC